MDAAIRCFQTTSAFRQAVARFFLLTSEKWSSGEFDLFGLRCIIEYRIVPPSAGFYLSVTGCDDAEELWVHYMIRVACNSTLAVAANENFVVTGKQCITSKIVFHETDFGKAPTLDVLFSAVEVSDAVPYNAVDPSSADLPAPDGVVVCGEERIPFHSAIAGPRFGYLAGSIRTEGTTTVSVPSAAEEGLDPDTVKRALAAAYSGPFIESSERTLAVARLLVAAKFLGNATLARSASAYIAGHMTDVGAAPHVLVIADRHGEPELKKVAIGFILHNLGRVMAAEGWRELSEGAASHLKDELLDAVAKRQRVE